MLVTTSIPVGQSSSMPGHRRYSINVTAKANEGLAKVTPCCGGQGRQPGELGELASIIDWVLRLYMAALRNYTALQRCPKLRQGTRPLSLPTYQPC